MLILNFFREAWRTLPRLIAVIMVTALGVTIFLGLRGLSANMQQIIDNYLEKSAMSDLWVTTDDADMRDVRALRALDAVEHVSPRVILNTEWKQDEDVILTLHAYDEITQCLPYFESGTLPKSPRECMLGATFAKARGYKLGDTLSVIYDERILNFTVCAFILTPEYIYNVTGTQVTPDPMNGGYFFVQEKAVATAYGEYVYNDILIKGKPGVNRDALLSQAKAVLGERCLAIRKFEDNGLSSSVYTERDSMASMATTFSSLCFLTAALIMFTTMQRIVEGGRGMMGTLKALGYTDARIAFYFVGYAVLVVVVGSLIGIAPASSFTGFFMAQVLSVYELPPLNFTLDWSAFSIAAAASGVSCLGAVAITLIKEVKAGPAECMRPKPPKKSRRNIVERSPIWRILGFSAKTVVRNIFRNRMRALMCIVGISLCMALVLTGIGMNNTIDTLLEDLFKKLYRYDLQIMFDEAVSERETQHIARMDGVNMLESEMICSVEAFAGDKRLNARLHIMENELELFVIDIDKEAPMAMPENGVIIGESFSKDMDLNVGESLRLKLIGTRKTYTFKVVGIVNNLGGIYIGRSSWRALGESFRPSVAYLAAGNPQIIKNSLEDHDFVESVSLKKDMEDSMNSQMESNNAATTMMIGSGGVLAFAVLYSLGIMNFYDRIRDLATLSVLGFYPKEIRQLILTENVVFTIVGIGFGVVLGMPLLTSIASGSSGDMTLVPVIYPASYGIGALLTLAYATIVNILLGAKTRKIDMLGALKSVE